MAYDFMAYDGPRQRRALTSRRGSRSMQRFRHRKLAGTWSPEPHCRHDLTAYEPPEDLDWRTIRQEQGYKGGHAATRHRREQLKRRAEREGTTASALRAAAKARGFADPREIAARAKVTTGA